MKKSIVYWSPYFSVGDIDWNIIYSEPEKIKKDIRINHKNKEKNLFSCPSFNDQIRNLFVVKNPMLANLSIENNEVFSKNNNYINAWANKESIENTKQLEYDYKIIFFSEDSIDLELTSPYFHSSRSIKKYSLIPGKFNISTWFRPVSFEFIIWENNDFFLEEDEPMGYIKFHSQNDIVLKRFFMDESLYKISQSCSTSSSWESKVPLLKRYKRFVDSKTNKIVLSKIQKNLI
jgi:hypothetical protein